MHLPNDLAILLDYARAEAKRAGHASVEPLHIAAAIARSKPDKYIAAFGAEADQTVFQALTQLEPSSGELVETPELVSMMEKAAQTSDRIASLIEELKVVLPELVNVSESNEAGSASEKLQANSGNKLNETRRSYTIPSHLAKFVELVEPDSGVIGRELLVDNLIGLLGQQIPNTPCVLGQAGSGRTSLFSALASRLNDPEYSGPLAGKPVIRIKAEAVIADQRAATLRQVLRELNPDSILVLDDVEILAALGGMAPDADMLGVIRSQVGNASRPMAIIMGADYFPRLEAHNSELAGLLDKVDFSVLPDETLQQIGSAWLSKLELFHNVKIPDEALAVAMATVPKRSSHTHPALMIDRLDHACTRAALRKDKQIRVDDVVTVDNQARVPEFNTKLVRSKLGEHVIGQDHALDKVVSRLTITRADIDIHPARPDGVFLFVGPTGVGKTALAKALALHVFGDEAACIRLDMSEYAHDWALSRIIGPQPGFVGYTEPEGWLTTRVREHPQALVLLDEIEKAHPTIWNAFLQVFDAGRLTDARGNVASFSNSVIVMTSNLGSEAFRSNPIGFQANDHLADIQSSRAVEAAKEAMPPELINRLDDIIVFNSLTRESIQAIAENDIGKAIQRLKGKGYVLSVSPEVSQFISDSGYDPAYGARHLQRNIERYLLQSLVQHQPGKLEAIVCNGEVEWVSQND